MNLSSEQLRSIKDGAVVLVKLEETECVVVRRDVYDRTKSVAYDDGEWRDDEMALLAAEAGRDIGWDEMDEYDCYDAHKQ